MIIWNGFKLNGKDKREKNRRKIFAERQKK